MPRVSLTVSSAGTKTISSPAPIMGGGKYVRFWCLGKLCLPAVEYHITRHLILHIDTQYYSPLYLCTLAIYYVFTTKFNKYKALFYQFLLFIFQLLKISPKCSNLFSISQYRAELWFFCTRLSRFCVV